MRSILDDATALSLPRHPDHLFSQPYETVSVQTVEYAPLPGPFAIKRTTATGVILRGGSGSCMRIDAVTPHVLRLRFSARGLPVRSTTEDLGLIRTVWKPVPLSVGRKDRSLRIRSGALALELDLKSLAFILRDDRNRVLLETFGGIRFSTEKPEYGGERCLASFHLRKERIFGLGGRIVPPDRTGTSTDMFAVKVGASSGDYGGFPIPFFVSTLGYGLFLNNPWPHVVFDMGKTRANEWFVHAPGGDCDFFLIHGPAFRDIVGRFTEIVGRIPFPEKWWLGFWCSSLAFKQDSEVVDIARRMRREGYPLDAMVLDGPWRGGPEFLQKYMSDGEYPTNDLKWHADFGNGPAMVRALKDLGIRTVLHQNSRSFKAATIRRGIRKGLLRRQGAEVVVRFTYPKAEKFYADQIRPRYKEGVALWWLDHGDRVSGEIRPGIPSRNLFGALWARSTQAAGVAVGRRPQLALIRGAGIGGQTGALPWPGDTRFGVNAFAEDIWFCLNAGLGGFPITSADLGGFMHAGERRPIDEPFDEENIARRFCQSLLILPTPRMHANDAAPPKLPWNCPLRTRSLYREMLALRYRLTPYFYSYAIHASRTGEPILRPLVYHHQRDAAACAVSDELYIGDWMLVAPVTAGGVTSRQVYLPAGEWVCFWSGRTFRGPVNIRVETPLYEPRGLPVFLKAGAILPSQAPVCCLTDDPPAELTLDVYPSGKSTFALHEAADCTNVFSCRSSKDGHGVFTMRNDADQPRVYIPRLHLKSAPALIALDGAPLAPSRQSWDSAGRIHACRIEMQPRTAARLMWSAQR